MPDCFIVLVMRIHFKSSHLPELNIPLYILFCFILFTEGFVTLPRLALSSEAHIMSSTPLRLTAHPSVLPTYIKGKANS